MFVVHGSAGTSADIFTLRLGRDRRIEPFVQRPGNQWAVRVSHDGKWISYASDESGRFEVYLEPSTRGQVKYQVSNDGGSEAVWSPAGNELFYRAGDRMMAVPITKNTDSPIGVPHVLFTGRYQRTDLPQYDVTPDGQRFVMVKPSVDELDARTIRLVEGWFDELKTTRAQSDDPTGVPERRQRPRFPGVTPKRDLFLPVRITIGAHPRPFIESTTADGCSAC